MTSGLILVDVQNEYFPGGRMELAGIEKASANASIWCSSANATAGSTCI
jgi:hypothetical protein